MASRSKQRRYPAFTLIELLVSVAIIGILALIGFSTIQGIRYRSYQVQCVSNLRAISQGFQLFIQDNDQHFPGSGMNGVTRWLFLVGGYMDLGPMLTTEVNGEAYQVLDNAYKYSVFHSPFTDPNDYKTGLGARNTMGVYGANDLITTSGQVRGVNLHSITRPERTILLAEHNAGYNGRDEEAPFVRLNRGGPYPQFFNGIASNREIHNSKGNPSSSNPTGPATILFADMHIQVIDMKDLNPWPGTGGSTMTFRPN